MTLPGVEAVIIGKTHPKRHLVLGSEGQIGKYVCDEIERNGDEVIRWDIVLDKDHDLRGTEGTSPQIEWEIMKADFVHFLAYDVGGSTYLAKHQDSYDYIRNNVRIMERVFHLLKMYEKPFYFASSQMSNMFHSTYGRLKAVGESYTEALGGLNVHFWNVYGYESDPEKTHVITDFINMALNDGRILCRTSGEEKRNFTHGADAAKMLYAITKNYTKFKPSQALPIVVRPRTFHSMRTIAEIISDQSGGGIPCYYQIDKTDTVQGILNEADERLHSEMMSRLFSFSTLPLTPTNAHSDDFNSLSISTNSRPFQFEAIEDGIADMIERIKKEG